MRRQRRMPVHEQEIGLEFELARGRQRGVEHAQRPGGRVARIGIQRQPFRGALRVQALELGARHEHFAAHFERRPRGNQSRIDLQRQRANGARVGGDVLAFQPVAARHGQLQTPVLILRRQRQPVELQLGHVGVRLARQELAHAAVELRQFLFVDGVVEAQHRRRMPHFDETRAHGAAHAPGGRVGGVELGMRGFEFLEPPQHAVVRGVADLGVVEDVI